MYRFLLFFGLVFFMSASAHAARRVPVFFSFGGEAISKVYDLPNTEDYQLDEGTYLDIGCKYKQVAIFFIPVWNYDKQWCGYVGNSNEFYDLSAEDVKAIAAAEGIKISATPHASFWHAYGGKLLLAFLVGGFGFMSLSNASVD